MIDGMMGWVGQMCGEGSLEETGNGMIVVFDNPKILQINTTLLYVSYSVEHRVSSTHEYMSRDKTRVSLIKNAQGQIDFAQYNMFIYEEKNAEFIKFSRKEFAIRTNALFP